MASSQVAASLFSCMQQKETYTKPIVAQQPEKVMHCDDEAR
jgi:hypothetical protein